MQIHTPVIGLTYSNYTPSAGHLDRLELLVGRGRVFVAASEQHALELAPSVDVLLGHRYLRQLLEKANEICKLPGVCELRIGFNDMRLSRVG
jgi:hypothetical protein